MASVKFFKVSSLPSSLQADAFYFVGNGDYAESYVTNSAGIAKAIGNTAMINALIDAKLSDFNALQIVATIADRNSFVVGVQRNLLILVTDATGDSTVSTGAALYSWNEATSTFAKLTEYESLDMVIDWSDIQNRPLSSVADIDDAVAKKHTHTNKTTLDKFTEDAEGPLFNGSPIAHRWSSVNW